MAFWNVRTLQWYCEFSNNGYAAANLKFDLLPGDFSHGGPIWAKSKTAAHDYTRNKLDTSTRGFKKWMCYLVDHNCIENYSVENVIEAYAFNVLEKRLVSIDPRCPPKPDI